MPSRTQLSSQVENAAQFQADQIENILTSRSAFLDTLLDDNTFTLAIQNVFTFDPGQLTIEKVKDVAFQNYERLSRDQATIPFDDFFLVDPNRNILISTDATLENLSLPDLPVYNTLLEKASSRVVYDLAPFGEGQFRVLVSRPYIDNLGLVAPGSSFNVSYRDHFRTTFLPDAKQITDVFSRIEELLDEYANGGPS